MLNTTNISYAYLNYYAPNRTNRYYPQIHFGTQNSIAKEWIYDSENTPSSTWPEKKLL